MNLSRLSRPVRSTGRWISLLALVWTTAAMPHLCRSATAQAAPKTVVAMPDVFPDVASRSLLVRTPGLDVVLLRDDDEAADALLMATELLAKLRAEHPAVPVGTGQMVPITGFVITREPGPGQRQRADAAIRRVRGAPRAELGSVGQARWIDYPGR
jgi:hypothetical protein